MEKPTTKPEFVRALRRRRGWSTRQLGMMVGRSHRTVENWEQGRRRIPEAAYRRLEILWNETKA